MKNKFGKSAIFATIAIIGSLLLILTLFLPFASATEEYRERLQEHPEKMYAEEINMTNEDAQDISLLEFARMYSAAADLGMSKDVAISVLVIIVVLSIFISLTTLFAVCRKPIAVLIFNLFSISVFQLIKWDFEDRGVLPTKNYDWGAAGIVCYIGIAIVVIGSILLLIEKIRVKRQQNQDII